MGKNPLDGAVLKVSSVAVLTPSFYLVSHWGPDGVMEELDADDGQQADSHRQDDGQPQVRLTQRVGSRTWGRRDNSEVREGVRKEFSFAFFWEYIEFKQLWLSLQDQESVYQSIY